MNSLKTLFKVFTFMFLITSVISATAYAQNLRIYHIDVDQADATLLVSPSNRTLLVDSGKNRHGDRLMAAMNEAGVTQMMPSFARITMKIIMVESTIWSMTIMCQF